MKAHSNDSLCHCKSVHQRQIVKVFIVRKKSQIRTTISNSDYSQLLIFIFTRMTRKVLHLSKVIHSLLQKGIKCTCLSFFTRIFCRASTLLLETAIPLISRISSPTCSVACRWIIPPCMILATMQRPSSVTFRVIPC